MRKPDRFVPPRRPTLDSVIESFRIGKDPGSLSPEERLLRRKDTSLDAFNPRRSVTSPTPRPRQASPSARRHFSGNRSGGGGIKANFSHMLFGG